MKRRCQACQAELDLPSEIDGQIVSCQRCEKKQQAIPGNVELREDRDSLTIIYRTPRRDVAWMAVLALVLVAVSVFLWTLPSNKWIDTSALLLSMCAALFVWLVAVLFFSQAKLRIVYSAASEAPAEPFRDGAARVGHTIEIYQRTVFSKRRGVLMEAILQVYCTEEIRAKSEGPREYLYHVHAILKSKSVVALVKDIHDLKTAQYIEAKIESFLQIDDFELPYEARANDGRRPKRKR